VFVFYVFSYEAVNWFFISEYWWQISLSLIWEMLEIRKFVNSYQQHDEEYCCPDDRSGKTEHEIWICEEDESRSRVDDLRDRRLLDVGHVAQDGEDEDAGDQAGAGVDHASDESVPEKKNNDVSYYAL
jgi:hypothetical protein